MPSTNEVLIEIRYLEKSGLKDISTAFVNPDGSFVFVEASAPAVESEITNVINSGAEPACIFGWSHDGKLRCRAVSEFRSSEKQVEILYQHKIHLIGRQDGTSSV
jgi:hypothetical protein